MYVCMYVCMYAVYLPFIQYVKYNHNNIYVCIHVYIIIYMCSPKPEIRSAP